jgi:hypothetical protein
VVRGADELPSLRFGAGSGGDSDGAVFSLPVTRLLLLLREAALYQRRSLALRIDRAQLATERKRGFPMDTSVMFLDCPAYMDRTGAARCGLPAAVEYRYAMRSTDGPLESVKIRCPRGHCFNGPLESMLWDKAPASPQRSLGKDAASRRSG